MKKSSYYLGIIVLFGILLTTFWVYQKYFRTGSGTLTTFATVRGDIQEIVRARGEVAAQKEFDLEFPFAGSVEKIYVAEGESVKSGAPLMKLETTELALERARLNAVFLQNKANLEKLEAGVTLEDINVYAAKVESAISALNSAKKSLVDTITDAYTKSDDAIRNKVDPLFINPRTAPALSFETTNSQIKVDTESARSVLEPVLTAWSGTIKLLTVASDLDVAITEAKANLSFVRTMHDKAALALNNLLPSGTLTQTTIDTWRANISAGRLSVSTAITNLTAAEEKTETARANLRIAENELALKRAGTRTEEITIANAQINEVKNEIASIDEKIAKALLRAPADAKVTKIWLERKETAGIGKTAISLSIEKLKVSSDISELDIGKVREHNGGTVEIEFDAFPGVKYAGSVLSIEQKEILKEGDKYFRVNVLFESADNEERQIRAGMSADLVLRGTIKKGVLTIPEIAVYKNGNKRFVKILTGNVQKETEVQVGISDGDSIEITNGLSEGDVVVVSE